MLDRPSPNFGERRGNRPIDMLVLHYTGMATAAEALERMCAPASEVSAHYMIDENGAVTRLVDEKKRAWHAGVAYWRGETDINSRSIGIELVNPGHEFGYRNFPDPQIEMLTILALDILRRHPIEPRNVVGHSDIAPERKKDPGEFFNWPALARDGIGLWPGRHVGEPRDIETVQRRLAKIGYKIEITGEPDTQTRYVVAAFQRHYRPERVDGLIDSETAGRLGSLLRLLGGDQAPS